MSIIISKNGKGAKRVERSSFDKEDDLQKYIHKNPESIPLYDIKEDINFLIISREFPTNSGPIDAIGIDEEGEIYIVETKLYKNSDKRKVVAQALDYGAALWKHSNDFNQFLMRLDEDVQKRFKTSLNEKLKEFYNLNEEELDNLFENIKDNLSDGNFQFVVLMDKLDSRLKDLILYVNQSSQFNVYAVELDYYEHESHEIIIPKLYGTEVKKNINVTSSKRVNWTEEKLLMQAKKLLSKKDYDNFKKIYDFSQKNADENRFGSGKIGTINPIWHSVRDKSIFTLPTEGRLVVNFHWLLKEDESNREEVEKLKKDLEKIGFPIPEDYMDLKLSFDPETWSNKTDEFIEVIKKTV